MILNAHPKRTYTVGTHVEMVTTEYTGVVAGTAGYVVGTPMALEVL